MAVKKFVFWVESEVSGMKIAFFFVIFDTTWTHILASKGPNMGLFKQNFSFQFVRKTEAILLPTIRLTNYSKNLKNNHFLLFSPKMGKILVLISLKCGISSYFNLQSPPRYFCNHYFLQNMKKPC